MGSSSFDLFLTCVCIFVLSAIADDSTVWQIEEFLEMLMMSNVTSTTMLVVSKVPIKNPRTILPHIATCDMVAVNDLPVLETLSVPITRMTMESHLRLIMARLICQVTRRLGIYYTPTIIVNPLIISQGSPKRPMVITPAASQSEAINPGPYSHRTLLSLIPANMAIRLQLQCRLLLARRTGGLLPRVISH